ncbi:MULTISPECIES: Hsp70 family protein [unclassified Streptomyces]|uniref:Hsp70 family protein n=1 Tax=unclassified Streptomyces TaxID=2593676 RepID=UPI000AA993C8|nr:Hsp70 family protein [Streptomyces sp. NRRL F-5122]
MDKRQHETSLVFGLVGGTFDVGLVDVSDGLVDVRSTANDSNLCGDGSDRRLVDHPPTSSSRRTATSCARPQHALQRLFEAVERVKTEVNSGTRLASSSSSKGRHRPVAGARAAVPSRGGADPGPARYGRGDVPSGVPAPGLSRWVEETIAGRG